MKSIPAYVFISIPNNHLTGTALGCALYMGPNRLNLDKYLLKMGAKIKHVSDNGTSNFLSACSNEDADPRVVQLLIQQCENESNEMINLQIRPQNRKWNATYFLAKICLQTGVVRSTLMKSLAERLGRTALFYAARRCDLEIIELLLSEGADPSVRDDMGKSIHDMCVGFPELKNILLEKELPC